MVINSRVCSLRVDLRNDKNDLVDPSMKQIIIPNHHHIEISQVYHCDGLLLCVTEDKDYSRLLVWNPYLGQTRLIQPRKKICTLETYALGYDNNNNNNRNYKIVRFFNDCKNFKGDIYDFSSGSWRVLDVNLDWDIPLGYSGVSLKGNTYFYFFGQEVEDSGELREVTDIENYLLCFDYTTEQFGPRLPLPLAFDPDCYSFECATLSGVRDEKLAVLYNLDYIVDITEVWITTKIEPNAVSWSKFLTLDMRQINCLPDYVLTCFEFRSFFIDEEKKVVVLFSRDIVSNQCQVACITGEDRYFKSVDNGQDLYSSSNHGKRVRSSYVPSLVQLQINQPDERKERINQLGKRKGRDDDQPVRSSILDLFLASFFFYFIFFIFPFFLLW